MQGFGGSAAASRSSPASAAAARAGLNSSMSTPGGIVTTGPLAPTTSLSTAADVLGADHGQLGGLEALARPALESGPATDRVFELGAVRLDAVAAADGGADGAAEQHVVGEEQLGGRQRADRRRVRLDVAGALLSAEVLQQAGVEPAVFVEDETGSSRSGSSGTNTFAPPRSYCPGSVSWQTTLTSWPARDHSRASERE